MPRFERTFKIWDYWVSHAQLLLRSPGDQRQPSGTSESRNIDLVFVSVGYIELPEIMSGLELTTDASTGELEKIEQVVGHTVPADQVFVISTNGRRYLIVAGAMWIRENDLGLMESTLDRGVDRPIRS